MSRGEEQFLNVGCLGLTSCVSFRRERNTYKGTIFLRSYFSCDEFDALNVLANSGSC